MPAVPLCSGSPDLLRPRPALAWLARVVGMLLLAFAGLPLPAANFPWNYAVQLTAAVDADQPRVTLRWTPHDPGAVNGRVPQYTVYRKRVSDLGTTDWGAGTTVPAGQHHYVDTLDAGVAYEYRVTRTYSGVDAQFNGVGYIRTGYRIPLVEDRGAILLMVESGVAPSLTTELDELTADLIGDGWQVVRVDGFSSSSRPAEVQARIRQEYGRLGSTLRAVYLLGRLPIAYSGTATNPDGHGIRPMPADTYYADVRGDWGGGSFDGQRWVFAPNTFPAPLALQVGRVDFANMPAVQGAGIHGSEVALLKHYLAKVHAFRTAQRVPERRALIGDAFGEYYFEGVVEPFSAQAYRNFPTLVGDRVEVADNFHGAANTAQWLAALTRGSYLWAFGAGAGGDSGDSMASLGPNGGELKSQDLVARKTQAAFYLFFGSYMVDWPRPNNLVRAALATPDFGLASVWSGRPFLYFHAMGLGETIGYGMLISENGSGSLYDTPVKVRPSGNTYMHGTFLALFGDPTLRQDPVPPVTGLSASDATGAATWLAPPNVAVQEYRVYRQNSTGRFERVAILPASTRNYVPTQPGRHMVRAVTLQTGSGTYYNASQGVTWNAGTISPPSPPPPTGAVRLGVPLLFTPSPDPPGPKPKK